MDTRDYRRNGYFGVGWGTIIPQSRVGYRRLFYLGKSARRQETLILQSRILQSRVEDRRVLYLGKGVTRQETLILQGRIHGNRRFFYCRVGYKEIVALKLKTAVSEYPVRRRNTGDSHDTE